MWDLDSIVHQNNQEALDYLMEGPVIEKAQQPTPEVWPLSLLVDKMQAGPPSLDNLLAYFVNIQDLQTFLCMIQDYVPEHKSEIMAEPAHRRVYRFCTFFSKKLFPLPRQVWDANVFNFVEDMPVWLMGLAYTAYHDLDMRPGFLMLLSLVTYPFYGDPRDDVDDDVPFDPMPSMCSRYNPRASDIQWLRDLLSVLTIGGEWIAPMGFKVVKTAEDAIKLTNAADTDAVRDAVRKTLEIAKIAGIKTQFTKSGKNAEEKINGARIPLIDTVNNMVGRELALRIPGQGWMPEELHKFTDGTKYDGVGDFASWACSDTGTVLLDFNYEDCAYVEGMGNPIFKWSKNNVDILTKQWPKVVEIRSKLDHVVAWLEKDPQNNFRELLEYLLAQPKITPQKRIPVNPGERWNPIPMDMKTDYEEEEDDNDETDGTGESRIAVGDTR